MAQPSLTIQDASRFARLALANIEREYPNKLDHVIADAVSALTPRELHPAFFGSFDWHSCVEMHWVLVRLLRVVPGIPIAREMRAALEENLTANALAVEARYIDA